jgi:hypothetical protein
MTTTTPRKRRPMIEMTGTLADLQSQDYVDEIGGVSPTTGINYRRNTVGRLVHRIQFEGVWYSERIADVLLNAGVSYRKAEAAATRPAHANVEFLGLGQMPLHLDVPVRFRRFAD